MLHVLISICMITKRTNLNAMWYSWIYSYCYLKKFEDNWTSWRGLLLKRSIPDWVFVRLIISWIWLPIDHISQVRLAWKKKNNATIRTSDFPHSMTMNKKFPRSYPLGHRGSNKVYIFEQSVYFSPSNEFVL